MPDDAFPDPCGRIKKRQQDDEPEGGENQHEQESGPPMSCCRLNQGELAPLILSRGPVVATRGRGRVVLRLGACHTSS
jgi:hypothetical protein